MKTKTEHTPTYDLTHLAMVGPDGIPVFLIPSATPDRELNERRKQERARIVCAVNSHKALLTAAKRLINDIDNGEGIGGQSIDDMKEAIDQAESKL